MKRKCKTFLWKVFMNNALWGCLCITCMLLCVLPVQAQSVSVRGTVTSAADGQPLIGVNIVEKGTTNGSVTDLDGNFQLSVSGNAVLTVSYIGYVDQEIKVTPGLSVYNVALREDSQALEEVVVVGYGVQKKKLVTGATVQVKGDDIQRLNTVSPMSALQSQTPGVNIMKKSGQPGEGFKVNIRGIGTIGNSQPLYIVDGIARDNIDYLNPADIESLDVLKDAASAAIYGARAANGVILVTTKQGKAGKAQISYDGYFGIQNVYKEASLLNAQDYAMIMNEAQENSGLPPYDFGAYLGQAEWNKISNGSWKGTNWLKEMKNENAPIHSHSLNVTGGSTQSVYSIGLSYTSQEGIYGKPVEPNYERYTVRVNTDNTIYKVNDLDIIKVGENLSYSYSEKSGIAIGNSYWNDINAAMRTNPFLPLWEKDANGHDIAGKYHYASPWYTLQPNPIGIMANERGQNFSKNHNFNGNVYAVIQPVKDLKFRTSFGVNMNANSYRSYKPVFDLGPNHFNTQDEVNQNGGIGLGWTFENTLSYVWKIKEDHNFDAMVGISAERWGLGESWGAVGTNSIFDDFNHAYIDNANVIDVNKTKISGSPHGKGGIMSYFGRINYNYKEKYMATVVMRADGSSNFSKNHRYGYFPSVSAGWVITNEDFMDSAKSWMDFLKIRASWGQNGNQSISAFQYLATISFSDAYYFLGPDKSHIFQGAYPDILPNEDVTWETSEQIDLGLDARFFSNRLGVNFDWYSKHTKDWLVQAPILASYGTGAPYINGGDISNKGVELALNWNDQAGDFTYNVTANVSYNKNEVTRIANGSGVIRSSASLAAGKPSFAVAEVGYPVGYFWGYKTDGLFQNEQEIANYKDAKGNVIMPTAQPGDVRFCDLNGDGVIDDNDKTLIGDPNPDVLLGLNINLGYKGFDLSISTNGTFGNQIFKTYRELGDNAQENYTTEILNRWHGEGTSNKIPRVTSGSHINRQYISDLYVENGDYWRINNVTLGYDFKKLFTKVPFQQLRLYVTAQNLFTITGYSGMDPEIGTSSDDTNAGWVSGVDVGFYPLPRTYMIGANIKF